MISDKKTLFMKSKESLPYEFLWLNESLFQQTIDKVNSSTIMLDKKICTIGYIFESNNTEHESTLKYDNSTIKIDWSRIKDTFIISKNPYYFYGVLRKKNDETVLLVYFLRILNQDFDCEAYKEAILHQRKLIAECEMMK